MPKSVNKVILVGNVGKDPEVRYSPSGIPVANFSLATNERFKDRNDEWQQRTEWHSIVAWPRLAEIVGEYVAKGSKVYVEGKLQTTSWEDRKIGRAGRGNTALRSSPATCCCWAYGKTAAAITKVRPPTRMKISLPTLALARVELRIFHSERLREPLHILTKGELS
jgi:primosomal replication protein N